MPQINIPTKTEVRSWVINELVKRDKIISKLQLNSLIEHEVMMHTKDIYGKIDKMRRRINDLENKR